MHPKTLLSETMKPIGISYTVFPQCIIKFLMFLYGVFTTKQRFHRGFHPILIIFKKMSLTDITKSLAKQSRTNNLDSKNASDRCKFECPQEQHSKSTIE